jgi:hypothetical protein
MKTNSEKHCSREIVLIYHSCSNKKEAMTHPGVDLSAIGSENRRMTHAGIPAGPARSDRVKPVPVRKKPYRLQLWHY